MLISNTWIKDITQDNLGIQLKSIDNLASVSVVNQILVENENDYLEGSIELVTNSEIILSKEMETTDLLFTWQTMIELLLVPNEKQYKIELLDSTIEVNLIVEGMNLIIKVQDTTDTYKNSYTLPVNEYKRVVKEGFIKFGNYLADNKFPFSEESSYPSFMSDYEKLKNLV